MQNIRSVSMNPSSKEEFLPGFSEAFPYIATRAELDYYSVPWHWHKTVELFFVESGALEYTTPRGSWIFPAGSGGVVNANVLHTSRTVRSGSPCVQLLHLFSPDLLSGSQDSAMAWKYILPLTTSGVDVLPLFPEQPNQAELLGQIKDAFAISPGRFGYEFQVRESLCRIWLDLLKLLKEQTPSPESASPSDSQLKAIIAFIHEHFPRSISIEDLAMQANISTRLCYRLFQTCLHTTPVEYIRSVRLQNACQLLRQTNRSVTDIAYSCGLGSSSYFGKLFREQFGLTPVQYRKKWQDHDRIMPK